MARLLCTFLFDVGMEDPPETGSEIAQRAMEIREMIDDLLDEQKLIAENLEPTGGRRGAQYECDIPK